MMTGAADGSIIPIIITAHITNSPNRSAAPQARTVMPARAMAACIRASAVIAFMAADSRSREARQAQSRRRARSTADRAESAAQLMISDSSDVKTHTLPQTPSAMSTVHASPEHEQGSEHSEE
jgi:hypothetical protein